MADHIFAFVTGTAVRWDTEDGMPVGDPEESHGWVNDREWYGDGFADVEFHESRNHVRPDINLPIDDEDLADEITDFFKRFGPVEDNGDGTFYSMQEYSPYPTDWNYTFAVHFKRKTRQGGEYVEVPWHPVTDGGITLPR